MGCKTFLVRSDFKAFKAFTGSIFSLLAASVNSCAIVNDPSSSSISFATFNTFFSVLPMF